MEDTEGVPQPHEQFQARPEDRELTRDYSDLALEFGIQEEKIPEFTEAAVQRAREERRKAAEMDSKYNILNSVGLHNALAEAIKTATEYKLPITGAFLDLAGLKLINDRLGQEGGDKAIHTVVEAINSNIRSSDIPGRVHSPDGTSANRPGFESQVAAREGGDEFVVLYIGTGLEKGIAATQRIMEVISAESDLKMPEHRQAFGKPLGSRAGVAQFDPELDKDGIGFLRRIGGAMYMTKRREGKMGVSAQIYNDKDYNTIIIKNFNSKPTAPAPAPAPAPQKV